MDDIRRQDQKLFVQELLEPTRLIATIAGTALLGWIAFQGGYRAILWIPALWALAAFIAYNHAKARRFRQLRFKALWEACEDRLRRFEEALSKIRKDQIADFTEMPKTIRRVSESLYAALRRADMISAEVSASEQGLYSGPPVWQAPSHDAQSKELYRLADRNIAEYRARYQGVMAGVQRTEAQSAVFVTTLDTLRMKMIGYRLVGQSPEMPSQDFLEALAEAKLQLNSIDHALEELELGPYPKQISVMPSDAPSYPTTPPVFQRENVEAQTPDSSDDSTSRLETNG